MLEATVTPSRGMRDSAFGAFTAAVLGLVLLEVGCILLKAKAGAHILSMLVGGATIALTLRRFFQCWPSKAQAPSSVGFRGRPYLAGATRIASGAIIGGTGYFAASTLASGFVTPFTLFAAVLLFMPWTRVARNRNECMGYGAVGAVGIGVALVTAYPWFNPILLLIVTWFLWMSAVAGWARIVLDERRIRRLAARRPGDVHHADVGAPDWLPGGAVSNETAHTNPGNLQH